MTNFAHSTARLPCLWVMIAGFSGVAASQVPTLSSQVRPFVAIDAPVVALTNVRLFNGTGARPADDQTIVISDGLITSVGPSSTASIPDGAQVVALAGRTVIPGLVGMHDHVGFGGERDFRQDMRLYLGAGVTTIRTGGTWEPYRDINLKREIDHGRYPGPKIHVTSPYVTALGARNLRMAQVADPAEARRFVDYWADVGVEWIKAYSEIQRAELAAVIDRAHARGLRVTGHLCAVTAREAAELGIDNIEHGPLSSDFNPDKRPDECPRGSFLFDPASATVAATVQTLVQKRVAITATFPEAEYQEPGRAAADARIFDFMSAGATEAYRGARAQLDALVPGNFGRRSAVIRQFLNAGGLLVTGIDPVFPGLMPGLADQRNYELLLAEGVDPGAALRIMTANGAEVLGQETRIGTIEPGKAADLVIISGDIVRAPKAIRNVVFVFKDGVGYDSQKLLQSVRQEMSRR